MVPFSHSRAMVNELSMEAMIIMVTAINPGTMKFLRFEIAVVPDADARIDGNAQRLASALDLRVRAQLRGIAFDDGVGIAQRDGGGVGVAAIDQQLDVGFIAREQVARVIARNDDAQQDGALVDAAIGGPVVIHDRLANLEIARTAKLVDQFAAFGRAVLIVDVGGDAVHVERERVAEQQQHDERQRQRESQAARRRGRCAAALSW